MTTESPYGSWPSPITAASLVQGAAGVAEVVTDGDDIWWGESRPEEGGRTALMRWRDGEVVEITPPEANVRTRVHEYGGGAWWVAQGVVWYSDFADQRLRRLDTSTGDVMLVSPEPDVPSGLRFADGRPTADGAWYVCVRERHADAHDQNPANEIVAVAADGSGRTTVLVSGPDFVASPRLSPDGTRLVWVQWEHPNMPWDVTELWAADFADGALSDARKLAGNGDEAIVMPDWGGDGELYAVTDRDDWWNLWKWPLDATTPTPVVAGQFEVATPQWVFNLSRWVVHSEAAHTTVMGRGRGDVVSHDWVGSSGSSRSDWATVSSLRALDQGVVFIGAAHDREPEIVRWDLEGEPEVIRSGRELGLAAGFFPPPERITFATSDDAEAHALYYAPAHPEVSAPADERPPLLVLAHGGPTAAARNQLQLGHRYWTSRGVAVVDVDYRGSTGYGRSYRHQLRDAWGQADVDDCAAAARFLVDRGDVDGERLMIRGGSAGGFTVLSALTWHDVFAAGASRYGVADLSALAADTHKFEARYLDGLVGPWPEAADVYEARSPINHTEHLSVPMILLQGDEDAIVPPNQAEKMVAALDAKGLPYAYVLFEGEQHGFRQAENIISALEAELSFFGQVLGFEPADDIVPVAVANLT